MAFETSNVKTYNLGGGLRETVGDWTGAVGDATGTVTVTGSRILAFQVWSNDASQPISLCEAKEAAGSATGTRTLTIGNISTVNDGHFWIRHR